MKRLLILAASAALLQGCAVGLVAAGGAGGVATADVMQTADRTFTAPLAQVRAATDQTLAQMGLKPGETKTSDKSQRIVATANDRTFDIDLDAVTDTTTRMTVEVKTYKGILRDGASANEVVQKTGEVLAVAGPLPVSPNAAEAPSASPPPPEQIQSQPLQ